MKQTVWITAALLALYVGSYFALVRAEYGWHGMTFGVGPYEAHASYRIGEDNAVIVVFYRPLQLLDKRMRPAFWADRL